MRQTALFLCFLLPTAFLSAQDPEWHRPPAQDLAGNRGEIARILHTTTDENIMLQIWQRDGVDEDTLFLKMLAGKRLGLYGTAAAAPILVARLDNEMDGFFARYALETIPGDEVDAALAEALPTLQRTEALAGVLTTLGVRANPNSAAAIAPFLTHEDADVRNAAAYAFAMTARGNALENLLREDKRIPFPVDSALLLAEQEQKGSHAGSNAFAASIYATIQLGEFGFVSFPGRLVFDAREHERLAAQHHFHDISVRHLNSVDNGLIRRLRPSAPRREFAMGLRAGRELPADARATVTRVMIAQLEHQTDAFRKALLVRAFGDRLDAPSQAVSLPVITELAQSGAVPVRIAAIDALRYLGDASVVPVLIEAALSEEQSVANAARNTLAAMPGEEMDAAITALLSSETPAIRIVAIQILAERRAFSAAPTLLALLQDDDAAVREAAVPALGVVSSVEDLPVLLGLLRQATEAGAETGGLVRVLMTACTRFSQAAAANAVEQALEGGSTAFKTHLLNLLREIAGRRALEIVEEYAWGDNAELRNAATRVLGEWRSPADLDQLAAACLRVAREHEEHRSRGLSAYLRLARQFNMPDERRLRMSREVFELAERDEQRMMVFDVFDRVVSLDSMEAAMAHIDNAAFRERAAEVAVNIAYRLQGRDARATAALNKVLEVSTNEAVKERAQRVLAR